ncbi:BrxE family protein [Desulfoferrobacter suflitae]|uniref:BrxE family protein n=1 Tax=Desulfoferrobacter suflitae TaxID=2865782 RepID=UPI0021649F8B|nr:BrxE family protein [Desulfoferrobacter suflitae]MCK8602713.1 BrxE family protein [Desulfoferrobacter suflitae]
MESYVGIDFTRLFKLHLTVARYGEMDVAKWWNTRGILGRYGTIAISRGFPRTHRFARARIAFAVARSRCEEVFNPPGCMTLWSLPAPVEDQFESQWQDWLDDIFPYLGSLAAKGLTSTETWSKLTLKRVAAGLLRMAVDFGLMVGTKVREFSSHHLPEESFLYLVHAIAESRPNAGSIINNPDWRMYLQTPEDVERELLHLHRYRKLHYEVAGSLAQLDLPYSSSMEYAREALR